MYQTELDVLEFECLVADHYERESFNENFTKIKGMAKEAMCALDGKVNVVPIKENIVNDSISIYKDPSII